MKLGPRGSFCHVSATSAVQWVYELKIALFHPFCQIFAMPMSPARETLFAWTRKLNKEPGVVDAALRLARDHAQRRGMKGTAPSVLAASLLIAYKLVGTQQNVPPLWLLERYTRLPQAVIMEAERQVCHAADWRLMPIIDDRFRHAPTTSPTCVLDSVMVCTDAVSSSHASCDSDDVMDCVDDIVAPAKKRMRLM